MESSGPNNDVRSDPLRIVVAVFATVGFLALGYTFLHSMRERQWMTAIPSIVAALAIIPWASYKTAARHCFTSSISIGVGSLCGIGTVFLFFALFNLDWFRDIFDHKDSTGPFGLVLFAGAGFFAGTYVTYRTLVLLTTQTAPVGKNADSRGDAG